MTNSLLTPIDRAIQLHQQGLIAQAADLYQAILQSEPRHPDANHNYGVLLMQRKNPVQAVQYFKVALEAMPQQLQFWSSYIIALIRLDELDQVDYVLQLARDQHIALAEADNWRSIVLERRKQIPSAQEQGICFSLHQEGNYTEGEKQARQLIARYPKHGFGLKALGEFLYLQGKTDEALEAITNSIELLPYDPELYNSQGFIKLQLKDFKPARVSVERALELQPQYSEAWNNLGLIFKAENNIEQAKACYKNSLAVNPGFILAEANLANVYVTEKKYAQAYPLLLNAHNLNPGDIGYLINLAIVEKATGQIVKAKHHFDQALSIDPSQPVALHNKSSMLADFGDFKSALDIAESVLDYRADILAWDNLLFLINYHPDLTTKQIFSYYQRYSTWLSKHSTSNVACKELISNAGSRKLRIAYISPDFRKHALSYFIEPLLSSHNKAEFELVGYSSTAVVDDWSQRFKAYFDTWLDITDLSDVEFAERIKADRIDILIDLAGHTEGNRLSVMPYRSAPVQVSYLGYGYTTGSPGVDYFIGDELLTPFNCDDSFSETVVRLPSASICYQPPENAPVVNELPAIKQGFITFGSLSRLIRLNDKVLTVWRLLLIKLPESRLCIDRPEFKDSDYCDLFYQRLDKLGLPIDRVKLKATACHWEAYRGIDISLDSFPHNAGTTLFESLWMGVPVVSKRDRPSVGRFGDMILTTLGMSRWVADTVEEYVEIACYFAGDLNQLAKTRAELRSRMQQSILLDKALFTHQFESTLKQLAEKHSKSVQAPVQNKLAPATADLKTLIQGYQQGNYKQALCLAEKLTFAFPDHPAAWQVMGAIYQHQGHLDKSLQAKKKALEADPDNADSYSNLANLYKDIGLLDESIALHRQALEKEKSARLLINLGVAYQESKNLSAALAVYKQAESYELNSKDKADLYNNLGGVYKLQGQLVLARKYLEMGCELEPDVWDMASNLACVYAELGLYDLSDTYHQIAICQPQLNSIAWDNYLFCQNYHPDISAEELFACYKAFADKSCVSIVDGTGAYTARLTEKSGRLKIGYISPDFKEHACRFFIEPLLKHHDKDRFELFAYSNLAKPDKYTARLKTYFNHWRDISGFSDQAVARQIHEDQLDILIDLAGHTAGNRLSVFALRAAPMQVSYMGYGYTTGQPGIDYFIGDDRFTPLESDAYFSEQLIRLPHTVFCYQAPDNTPLVNSLPALQRGGVTFGSLTRTIRLNDHVLKLWAEIIQRVPNSHLLLDQKPFAHHDTREYFYQRLEGLGLPRQRVSLVSSENHWLTYHQIDISLDSFPHNSGTTLFESLWMGVPIISKVDKPSVGRFSATILPHVGLDGWLAETPDEYIDKAVALASDLDYLAQLRQALRQRMLESPLMDAASFTNDFEQALIQLFQTRNVTDETATTVVLENSHTQMSQDSENSVSVKSVRSRSKGKKSKVKKTKNKKPKKTINKSLVNSTVDTKKLLSLYQGKQFELLIKEAQTALSIAPDHPFLWKVLGASYQSLGLLDKALSAKLRSVEIAPGDAESLNNLGYLQQVMNLLDDAAISLGQAVSLNPALVDAWNNLSIVHKKKGNIDEAVECLKKALEISPDHAYSNSNLGVIYVESKDYASAQPILEKAVRSNPGDPKLLNNLGVVYLKTGQPERAYPLFERAVDMDDGVADFYSNKGLALDGLNKREEALYCFEKAYSIDPDNVDYIINLPSAYIKVGRYVSALSLLKEALDICPDDKRVNNSFAGVSADIGDFYSARKYFKIAMEKASLDDGVYNNNLFICNYDPDISARELFLEYRDTAEKCYPFVENNWSERTSITGRRLRIGYISPDFKAHACRYFIEPLIKHHNRSKVELFAYANVSKSDQYTEEFKDIFEHWRHIFGQQAIDVAQQIDKDQIDILIDLAGHTVGNRLDVMALRPAPIQVSHLGYGYTTGLSQVDYFIGDPRLTPEGCDPYFSEKIIRMESVFSCYQPPADQVPDVSLLPALSNGFVTFGSLSRTIRLNDRVLGVWAKILHRLPTARLWLDQRLFAGEETVELFYQRLEKLGLPIERVILKASYPHWNAYHNIDISLDAFPHNAGTTLFESLLMGVPVISKRDRPSVGRFGDSILVPVGLDDWVVDTEEEYIECAVKFAGDIDRLVSLRKELRAKLKNSDFMQPEKFAQEFEKKLLLIAQQELN